MTVGLEHYLTVSALLFSLGLLGVVIHPGTCTSGSEDEGLRLIAGAIGEALAARDRAACGPLAHRFARLLHAAASLDDEQHLHAAVRMPRRPC